MNGLQTIKITLLTTLVSAGLMQTAQASSTMVTDAIGTQELWTFQEVLGAQKLVSKVNQTDGKGVSQIWDANGNKLSRADAEGRVSTYTYNASNQKTSMTVASGTADERTTFYEYVSADIDRITKVTRPSVSSNEVKEQITVYDSNLNVSSLTISGFDALGGPVSRTTSFSYDQYGKVTQIDGPRTDVLDITSFEYYDCNTGAECGQLKKVANALGHETSYDSYDLAGRLLQTTDGNGVITTMTYHPRGWLLTRTQTPPTGSARVSTYGYDNVGQLVKTTFPDLSEQNYVYDAAHDLRELSDNLGNTVRYTYDEKGNRTDENIFDLNNTLVRSTTTAYDIRNFVQSINSGGSVTQLVSDAVGNLGTQTDPNQNPSTNHNFDALDRLTSSVDALTNSRHFEYNVADQLIRVEAPNGATTSYEYDDLGNQTKEFSPDRGALVYSYDSAGNVLSISDARGISQSYQYDALNRVLFTSYPNSSENINYLYDSANCGASIGRLCQVTDETGQTNYEYDAWGNVITQTKQELGVSYITRYQYDSQNRVVQMTYPNGRLVHYQRDAIGRVQSVTTTVGGAIRNVVTNRAYRADGVATGQTLGNGLVESRAYDQQSRVTQINLGTLESWSYVYDANGNVTQIAKPVEGRDYAYDVLDRVVVDTKVDVSGILNDYIYEYDANGNRIKRNNRTYSYAANSNLLLQDGNINITRDAVGNTLSTLSGRTFTYSDRNRLKTVSKDGVLKGSYFYNASGQRTRKERPSQNSFIYHYDLAGNLILKTIQNGKPKEDYIWLDGELVQYAKLKGNVDSSINQEIAKTFITSDHLATPRIGTNDAQVMTWRWDSDAFNKKRPNKDPDSDTEKVNLKIGFPGQYWDAESGLYYNWNRYYDAKSGRYVTSDPIGLQGGLNTYGYVAGNPLRYTDRFGLLDPDKPLRFKPQLNPIKPVHPGGGAGVITGLGKALGALGLLLHSEPLGEGSDNPESQCFDDDSDNKDCKKASKSQLKSAGIIGGQEYRDEHDFKKAWGAVPNSLFDICACKDGSIVIRAQGMCGTSGPTMGTDARWK